MMEIGCQSHNRAMHEHFMNMMLGFELRVDGMDKYPEVLRDPSGLACVYSILTDQPPGAHFQPNLSGFHPQSCWNPQLPLDEWHQTPLDYKLTA